MRCSLPDLRADLKTSLADVASRLSALPPPPPENPAGKLLQLVASFSSDVGALVQGAESFERLMQHCRPAYARFKRDIRGTAPDFVPFTCGEDPFNFKSPVFEPDTEDEEDLDSGIELYDSQKTMHLDAVRQHIQKYVPSCFVRVFADSALSSLTRELPHNVPYSAKVTLIQRSFVDWDEHCNRCFGTVHAAALAELKDLVRTHFSAYKGTALLDHVDAMVESQVECCRVTTVERVQWMLALESPPFTLNDHYFSSYREKYLTRYKDARKVSPITFYPCRCRLSTISCSHFNLRGFLRTPASTRS